MRLFRQIEKGDWDPVFKQIAAAVEHSRRSEPASDLAAWKTAITVSSSIGELIDKITNHTALIAFSLCALRSRLARQVAIVLFKLQSARANG
jgi:hypothetical protein